MRLHAATRGEMDGLTGEEKASHDRLPVTCPLAPPCGPAVTAVTGAPAPVPVHRCSSGSTPSPSSPVVSCRVCVCVSIEVVKRRWWTEPHRQYATTSVLSRAGQLSSLPCWICPLELAHDVHVNKRRLLSKYLYENHTHREPIMFFTESYRILFCCIFISIHRHIY